MASRRVRVIVVLMLIAAGGGAAWYAWATQQAITELERAEQTLDGRLDRMIGTAGDIFSAQQAYVAPGQPDGPWLTRVASLIQQLTADVAAVRGTARSSGADARLQSIAGAAARLADVDARTRENLRFDLDLIAADLIFSEGRPAMDALVTQLRTLRAAERTYAADARSARLQQSLAAVGGVALLWLAGLALLVRVPAPRAEQPAAPLSITAAPSLLDDEQIVEPTPLPQHAASIDLGGVADLCTAISRMTVSAELPELLARAAALLDASGLIIWMSAGEELFAVTAHGYDPQVINRLGSIGRHADNATAASWRNGELTIVPGDVMSNGALVAPMFGPDRCIGVLAAELRHGRETETETRAVTALIAAQLATVVAAWPAASGTPAGVASSARP